MKLALIFLTVFVAISHQQYFRPRMLFGFPWMSPFSQQPVAINDYVNEEVYPGLMGFDNRNGIEGEEEFADIQSRIKGYSGLSRYRPSPSFNDMQNARFFFNLGNTGNTGNNANNINNGIFNNNPFFKTATFTSTQTLTLVSVVSCVPPDQVVSPVPACRRKREDIREYSEADRQFEIYPSETMKLIPTATNGDSSPTDRSLDLLLSSKDDVTQSETDVVSNKYNSREKRFFINKNQFIVTSVVTTYAFVNQTITATVNLLNPVPSPAGAGPCLPANGNCVNCLPTGFVVCPPPAAG